MLKNFFKKWWYKTELKFDSLEEAELHEILSVFTTVKDKLEAYATKLTTAQAQKEQEIKDLEAELAQIGALNVQAVRVMNNLEGLVK
jgi:hypothetical protein